MEERLYAKDLYQYLVWLQEMLKQRGEADLSEKVRFASRFAVGSTTELYHEAEAALQAVKEGHKEVLSDHEMKDLQSKLTGIRTEFRLIGGA